MSGTWRACALGTWVGLAPAGALAYDPAGEASATPEVNAEGPREAASSEAPAPPPAAATQAGPPSIVVTPLRRARHDWYAGFSSGLGVGNLRTKLDGGTGLAVSAIGPGRAGGRLRDNLLLGGALVSSFGVALRSQGLLGALVEVLGYPAKGKGLVMSAALGIGAYWKSDVSMGVTDKARPAGSAGILFGAGFGYEFWLARRFNLGLMLRGDGIGSPAIGLRAAGTLGLSFTWY